MWQPLTLILKAKLQHTGIITCQRNNINLSILWGICVDMWSCDRCVDLILFESGACSCKATAAFCPIAAYCEMWAGSPLLTFPPLQCEGMALSGEPERVDIRDLSGYSPQEQEMHSANPPFGHLAPSRKHTNIHRQKCVWLHMRLGGFLYVPFTSPSLCFVKDTPHRAHTQTTHTHPQSVQICE